MQLERLTLSKCAGGVTVSYLEWVQYRQHFEWEQADVWAKLEMG